MIIRDAEGQTEDYSNKLFKILPAELTAVYFGIRAMAEVSGNVYDILLVLAVVLAILFYFLASKLINIYNPINKILYCLTFLIWVLAIDAGVYTNEFFYKLGDDVVNRIVYVVSATAAIWSFVVPILLQPRG